MTTRRSFIATLLAAPAAALALAHTAKAAQSYVTLQDLGYEPPPHGQLCKRHEMTYDHTCVGYSIPGCGDPFDGKARVWCGNGDSRDNISWDYGQTYGQNPLRYDAATKTYVPILDVRDDWRARRVTWLEEVHS